MDELAQAGAAHGGGTRPFGYERDRLTLRPDEAAIVKDLAARLLAGESLASLTRWLNDQEIPTSAGGAWRSPTLRGLLRSGRISGQREQRGAIVGPAVWPPIIPPEQTDRIRALLDDPARRVSRTARRYLLAGMLRCSLCGATLMSHPRAGVRRYVCKTGADFTGCGRITITADPLEQFIADAVLLRLDSPGFARSLRKEATADAASAALAEAIEADTAQLDELAGLYAAKAITAAEWMTARKPIEARISDAKRRLSRASASGRAAEWAGNGQQLRAQWAELNLDRQRAIVAAVLDHAIIAPGTRGAQSLDINRITPRWRV
nr:recombinase family protein [Motilibacter deserti]